MTGSHRHGFSYIREVAVKRARKSVPTSGQTAGWLFDKRLALIHILLTLAFFILKSQPSGGDAGRLAI
jgi:hypothetical protein